MIEFRKTGEIRQSPIDDPVVLKVKIDGKMAKILSDMAHDHGTTVAEIARVGIARVVEENAEKSKD